MALTCHFCVCGCIQWRNEPKHLGGRNLCEGAIATKPEGATERRGVPPPTVGSFFIF